MAIEKPHLECAEACGAAVVGLAAGGPVAADQVVDEGGLAQAALTCQFEFKPAAK